jgi:hypothetical protein
MAGLLYSARTLRWLPALLWTACLSGQTCLALSRPAFTPDHTAVIEVALYSRIGAAPAAVQWVLQDTASSITSFTVADGPQSIAAGKTTTCAGNPAYRCLTAGFNANPIGNGVIARITAVLSSDTIRPAARLADPMAASAEGYFIPIRIANDCRLYRPVPWRR